MTMNLIFVIGKKLLKFDNIINFISKVNSIMDKKTDLKNKEIVKKSNTKFTPIVSEMEF